ncbi:branched-chain amino acid ABC transporter permease [Afipia sp. DC4300-2b1]|uniref:branched-chain amino acid ABC transporter permease n=1 Tax=Afipia sp. DC4300-2b1 TaxID=2804672 RepID=UPI003CF0E1FA
MSAAVSVPRIALSALAAAAVLGTAYFLISGGRVTPHVITLVTDAMIFGIFALALNVLLGWTGLVSLGHSLFYALGAYGTAVFSTMLGLSPATAMAASIALALLVALVIGAVATRATGMHFLLLTLAFGEMFYAVSVKIKLFGGDDGIIGISRPDIRWLGINTDSPIGFSLFTGFFLILVVVLLHGVSISPFGAILRGIRENERRMSSLGYVVWRYKLAAFALSGAIAGLAGTLATQHLQLVNPEFSNWLVSGEGLLMVIIGGAQVLLGPILGSFLFVVLKDGLSNVFREHILLFGLFFVFTVIFFRGGIGGSLARLWGTKSS